MQYFKTFGIIVFGIFFSGCVTIEGGTRLDKINFVLDMRDTVLEQLYELKPEAQQEIDTSSGYAVFSNVNSHLIFLSTGNGFGVLTNQATGEETFMKMFSIGGGLGLGAKDFRVVIIFRNEGDVLRFAKGKWDFSGSMDVAAKSSEKGGSLAGAGPIGSDVKIYQITEAGLILHATLEGTKYYRYHELN